MPSISSVTFDKGKLRTGTGNKIYDRDGFPIITTGHIEGPGSDPLIASGDSPTKPDKRYTIKITSTQGRRTLEWKGRIIGHEPDQLYGWHFAVVLTKNESSTTESDLESGLESDLGAGDGEVVVTVTVTTPAGEVATTTPPAVPLDTIP